MDIIILHHPKSRDAPHLQNTWKWVEENRAKYNIITKMVDVQNPFSWAEFLQEHWNQSKTIVWIGHDVVPVEGMMEKLLECPNHICAQAALILKPPVIALRHMEPDYSRGSWIAEGEEWADAFNMELTKLDPYAQRVIGPVPQCIWQQVDNELSKMAINKIKAHVHWPLIEHNSLGRL